MKPTHELLARIAERLKALADPTRLKILHSLEEGELTVTEILEQVGGSQANVSKHLGLMRRVGVLESRREGVNVFYRVIDPAAFAVCRSVCDALERRADSEHKLLRRAVAAARRIEA
jgi:DNA-binding transcriptional ArsR family regulator